KPRFFNSADLPMTPKGLPHLVGLFLPHRAHENRFLRFNSPATTLAAVTLATVTSNADREDSEALRIATLADTKRFQHRRRTISILQAEHQPWLRSGDDENPPRLVQKTKLPGCGIFYGNRRRFTDSVRAALLMLIIDRHMSVSKLCSLGSYLAHAST